MPELPEGTINAFIQNKNLAKYGLLKDNDGGYLAENFVDYQLIDRHETLEEIVAVGWMSDFHPFNKDLVADPSPKILVIVDREQTYGDFWRVCLTAEAQEPGADYFKQMDDLLPTPTETRIATGAPGPDYWQQKVDYHIKVTVDDGVLAIQGERKQEAESSDHKVHRIERFYGRFMRRFTLPDNVDENSVKATFKDGLLTRMDVAFSRDGPEKVYVQDRLRERGAESAEGEGEEEGEEY